MSTTDPRPLAQPGLHEAAWGALEPRIPEGGGRAVDLGAGQGAMTARLSQSGLDVVPVDITTERWKLPDVPLTILDLDEPFADRLGREAFDVCVALEVIEHLESPFQFVRECGKLLRPGGLMVLSSPNVETIPSRLIFLWNGRLRFFSEDETQGHHLTPLFSWQLDLALAREGFELVWSGYNRDHWAVSDSLKGRLASLLARPLARVLKGDTTGEIRVIVARRPQQSPR